MYPASYTVTVIPIGIYYWCIHHLSPMIAFFFRSITAQILVIVDILSCPSVNNGNIITKHFDWPEK